MTNRRRSNGDHHPAADARPTVTDGETTVENVDSITFEGPFTVDGSGTGARIDR
ncbi:MAG: hypothetical protein ABEJ89_02000 [Haloarculaceae archaeon]